MSVFGIGTPTALPASILQLGGELRSLQTQLGTGRKAETYGAMGGDRTLALDLRGEIAKIGGYQKTIQTALLRTNVAGQALERIDEMLSETRSSLALSEFETGVAGQTIAQYGARESAQEYVALLNSEVGGTYLFSGKETDKVPVPSIEVILEGEGTRAGLRTLVDQRIAADAGADGLGRLSLPGPAGGTVTLAEDGPAHPFGLKLSAIDEQLTGTTAVSPAGSPVTLSVTFTATPPVADESVTLTFDLPDGSTETLTLKATNTSPPGDGKFLIGADAATTASNFQTALDTAIKGLVATSGKAASLSQAGRDFFEFDSASPPQRVDGPPYETATALVDATASDTVFWYAGEQETTDPRGAISARIDTGYTIDYGLRANEAALRDGLKFTALIAVVSFDGDTATEKRHYAEVKERLAPGLLTSGSAPSVRQIATEVALKSHVLEATQKRHNTATTLAQTTLDATEGVDLNEVGARILALQTHLQASFQATSILSRLSLTQFL